MVVRDEAYYHGSDNRLIFALFVDMIKLLLYTEIICHT